MSDHSPILSPPPELRDKWLDEAPNTSVYDYLIDSAAQWGADQELEACCEWLVRNYNYPEAGNPLRATRRPERPTLKEEALEAWEIANQTWTTASDKKVATIILRAIKALPND